MRLGAKSSAYVGGRILGSMKFYPALIVPWQLPIHTLGELGTILRLYLLIV
jgi:hypothetical protein